MKRTREAARSQVLGEPSRVVVTIDRQFDAVHRARLVAELAERLAQLLGRGEIGPDADDLGVQRAELADGELVDLDARGRPFFEECAVALGEECDDFARRLGGNELGDERADVEHLARARDHRLHHAVARRRDRRLRERERERVAL